MKHPKYFTNTFEYFRKVWSPRASYHLTRALHGEDWKERLVSRIWLAHERIPHTGEVPSMDFRGIGQKKIHKS